MRTIGKSPVRAGIDRHSRNMRGAFRSLYRELSHGRRRGEATQAYPSIMSRNLTLENLEPRQLLAASPIISEFLARNDGGLRDGDGRTSDWIEIFNAGDQSVNLEGYRLTDDRQDLARYVFPTVNLDPGQYRIVFASGRQGGDPVDADGNLHTNFTLRRSEDYIALVSPTGAILSEFGSNGQAYPEQLANVSYGVGQSFSLITPDSAAYYLVPVNDDLGSSWTERGFDAARAGFALGTASLGFEGQPSNRTNFVGAFQTELPLESHGVYTRIEFDLNDASAISKLSLKLKYDNGFIAYLNGAKVAQQNTPATVTWFSTAPDGSRNDSQALEFVEFDLTAHAGSLVDGKNVLALHGLNNVTDKSDMLLVAQMSATASDMQAATGTPARTGYMTTATPGAPNVPSSDIYGGFVADTAFSIHRGFYYQPIQVEITTETPGAEIRYTTDGSPPTATTGSVYSGPITISTTTTLRAAAFKPDAIPTNIDTQTYIFPLDVMKQDASYIKQEFARWGHAGPDWEMDPEILNHPDPESRPTVDDLLSLPHLSLVVDWAQMFGERGGPMNGQGIYIRGEGVEIPVSAELINPDGSDGFQHDGSVQIVGGSSPERWKVDKLSMRLKFNQEFGSGDLQFPVFGENAAQSFDTLVVDAHLNNVWHYGGTSDPTYQRKVAEYVRDAMGSDLQNAMGGYGTHDKFVFVSINGIFWGMHRLHERPDDNFAAAYLGGDNDDYDVLKHSSGTVIAGSNANYSALLKAVRQDMSDPANYQAVAQMLHIDNFIDYMLINFYGGNMDWPQHNWYASFNRNDPAGRWRFHSWDAEKLFQGLRDDKTSSGDTGSPGEIHQLLVGNSRNPGSAEYRLRFADHIQSHFFNDGVLTPENVAALYQIRLDEVDAATKVESARWGDNQRAQPYTRGDDWVAERDRLLNEYLPQRTQIAFDQLKRRGLYPKVNAPTFNQHGGVVPASMGITLTAAQGTIYYTTDASDPRLAGGAVAANARQFTEALHIADTTTIKARVLHNGEWSALTEAEFRVASNVPLRITEINYNPHEANPIAGLNEQDVGTERFEFLELVNVGQQPIDLAGVRLVEQTVRSQSQGVVFNFASQLLRPGERIVIVSNREAFQSRYGNAVRIAEGNDGAQGPAGQYGGQLSDRGERLTLVDSTGKTIQQFDYRVRDPWPTRANGLGSSLEVIDPLGGYTDASNFQASSEFGGSPGRAPQSLENQIVINEVLANPLAGHSVSVELYNPTRQDVTITNWYMSNSSDNFFQSKITAPVTVRAGGYHVLTDLGFPLDGARGDDLWLLAADASGKPRGFVDHIQFETSLAGVTMGPSAARDGALVQLAEPTLGRANSGPWVSEVILSEVSYNPTDPDGAGGLAVRDFEFIELYNRTNSPVDVSGWELTGDIVFTLPQGTVIGAREALAVVGFDPTTGTKATVFRFTMGMDPTAPLVGRRFTTTLGDTEGVVRLLRPGVPPADAPNFTPKIVADGVAYQATAPWPTSAAGQGDSLTRVSPSARGDLASSWTGKAPSPGSVDFVVRHPGDSNEDGQFNQLDITLVLQGAKYNTGQPATWSQGDWNGDGVFNQLDLVAALQTGAYLRGPLAAYQPGGKTDSAVDAAMEEIAEEPLTPVSLRLI
jgi:hypothetical protein